MTPRCPSCTYPVPAPGLCVVCASGVPVQRITVADMQAAYDAQTAASSHTQRTRATAAPSAPPCPPKPAQGPRAYPCDMPGCTGTGLALPVGYARLHGAGRTFRCAPCKRAHKLTVQRHAAATQRATSGADHRQEARPMPLMRPATPKRCAECGEWHNPDAGAWWVQMAGPAPGVYGLCFDCAAWLGWYARRGLPLISLRGRT